VNFEAFAKFSEFGVKRRNAPHKMLYNFASKCKSKFQTEFESQMRTISMFANKLIWRILYKIHFSNSRAPKIPQNYS
jgi:hypothetical protein